MKLQKENFSHDESKWFEDRKQAKEKLETPRIPFKTADLVDLKAMKHENREVFENRKNREKPSEQEMSVIERSLDGKKLSQTSTLFCFQASPRWKMITFEERKWLLN